MLSLVGSISAFFIFYHIIYLRTTNYESDVSFMKVSVILTTYNSEGSLQATLDSVSNRTGLGSEFDIEYQPTGCHGGRVQ